MQNKINEKRTAKMRKKSLQELKQFAMSGSLSSAAAAYEMQRRNDNL